VESIAPAPSRHLPPGELVHNDDLAILRDDVLLIFLEEGIRLEELVNDVHPLALSGILPLERLDLRALLVDAQRLVLLDRPDLFREIRNQKCVRISRRELINPPV
jgi:hypothetical protein